MLTSVLLKTVCLIICNWKSPVLMILHNRWIAPNAMVYKSIFYPMAKTFEHLNAPLKISSYLFCLHNDSDNYILYKCLVFDFWLEMHNEKKWTALSVLKYKNGFVSSRAVSLYCRAIANKLG